MRVIRQIAAIALCFSAGSSLAVAEGMPGTTWRCDVKGEGRYDHIGGYVELDAQGSLRGGYVTWIERTDSTDLPLFLAGTWPIGSDGKLIPTWRPTLTFEFFMSERMYRALHRHKYKYRVELTTQPPQSGPVLPPSAFMSEWQHQSLKAAEGDQVSADAGDLAALVRGSDSDLYLIARDLKGEVLLSEKIDRGFILGIFPEVDHIIQTLMVDVKNYKTACGPPPPPNPPPTSEAPDIVVTTGSSSQPVSAMAALR